MASWIEALRSTCIASVLGVAFNLASSGAMAVCVAHSGQPIGLQSSIYGWTVPVTVNRSELPFLLDTGAERSLLFADAADRIGVRRDEWVATTTQGIGGDVRLRNADPDTLSLGGLALRRHTLAADHTLVVSLPPRTNSGTGLAGLLGQDMLSPFDIQIDGPGGALTLVTVSGCSAKSLPWSTNAAVVPAVRIAGTVLLIPVEIDGHVLQAEIDSGSTASLVTASGMGKLGLSHASLANDPAGAAAGVGPDTVAMHRHRFGHATIAGTRLPDPALWVAPVHILRSIDLLIGRDWLVSHVVWISYSTNTVFVAHRT